MNFYTHFFLKIGEIPEESLPKGFTIKNKNNFYKLSSTKI